MQTQWIAVRIPKSLADKIDMMLIFLGFTSRQEYVREKIRAAVSHDELKLQIEKEQREDHEGI